MEPWQRARDARPVVGAGPGFGRDRPQPGDERRAGIGSQGRAPRRDVRHRQAGEGRGRRARPRGTRVRGGGRPDRPHVAGIACVRMANGSFGCTASAADVSARGIAGRACAAAMDTRGPVPRAPEQAVSWGRLAWRHGRSRAPFRPWRAAHRPRVRHRGRGMRHASHGRHGRRPVRQRHGRGRRRRVQDRARPATQALPGSEGPGIGDVPVGLVAGTRSVRAGPRATGHRNGPNRVLCKPSGASRPTIRTEKSGHIKAQAVNS